MKKSILKFTALTCAVAGACAVFAGCSETNNDGGIKEREEFYGLGAVSCVEILGSSLNAKSAHTFAALAKAAVEEPSDDIKAQAENFNKYFAALNSFLDDNALSINSEKNTDAAYAQYVMKLTVNGKDIAGNATEYVMYYNETFVDQKVDKDETESRYTLEGVMLSGGVEYRLTGGKEIEEEDGEREEELKIRAYTDETSGNFVEMKSEVSQEKNERENEFVYRIYSENKLVEETKVEFETEVKNGKTETEYELEFRNGNGKGKYKVEREVKDGGKTEISVKYSLDGKQGAFKIKEIIKDGVPCYEYTFEDNQKIVLER